MMLVNLMTFLLQSELARCLEDEEYDGFQDTLGAAREVGYNLDEHYGKEVGLSKRNKDTDN